MVEAFPFGHLGEFEMLIDDQERSGMKTKDQRSGRRCRFFYLRAKGSKAKRVLVCFSGLCYTGSDFGIGFGLGISMKYGWHTQTYTHTFREKSKNTVPRPSCHCWMANSADSELMPCGWNRNRNALRSEQFVVNNLVNKAMTNTFFLSGQNNICFHCNLERFFSRDKRK